jgi:SHS2 domain-containing protein
MVDIAAGHRGVPHTADLRIEAWAPSRDGCIRQAVLGTVESFLDISSAGPRSSRSRRLTTGSDGDLLVAVLEEVIFLLDTAGEAPIDLDLKGGGSVAEVNFTMVDARTLPQVGAVPKAVSLNDLRFTHNENGWRCLVTLDV